MYPGQSYNSSTRFHNTNLVSYVAPLFAALSGWAFLSETPTSATGLGFLFVFAGFLLLKRDAVRAELARVRGEPTS